MFSFIISLLIKTALGQFAEVPNQGEMHAFVEETFILKGKNVGKAHVNVDKTSIRQAVGANSAVNVSHLIVCDKWTVVPTVFYSWHSLRMVVVYLPCKLL